MTSWPALSRPTEPSAPVSKVTAKEVPSQSLRKMMGIVQVPGKETLRKCVGWLLKWLFHKNWFQNWFKSGLIDGLETPWSIGSWDIRFWDSRTDRQQRALNGFQPRKIWQFNHTQNGCDYLQADIPNGLMGVKQLLQNQRPTRTGILEDEMSNTSAEYCFFFFLRATSFDGYGAYIKRYLATAPFFCAQAILLPVGVGETNGWRNVNTTTSPMATTSFCKLNDPGWNANWLPTSKTSQIISVCNHSILRLSSAAYQVSFKQQGPYTSLESASLSHVSNYFQISVSIFS